MSYREHRRYLQDLLRVGDAKPLGYLPLGTLEALAGVPRAAVERWCRRRGLMYAFFTEGECRISKGAVYVGCLPALKRLLDAHSDVVKKAGWPREPIAFMRTVAMRFADAPKLYALVGRAFADPRFPDIHPMLRAPDDDRTDARKQAASRPG